MAITILGMAYFVILSFRLDWQALSEEVSIFAVLSYHWSLLFCYKNLFTQYYFQFHLYYKERYLFSHWLDPLGAEERQMYNMGFIQVRYKNETCKSLIKTVISILLIFQRTVFIHTVLISYWRYGFYLIDILKPSI